MVTGCVLTARMLTLPKEKVVTSVKARDLITSSTSIKRIIGLNISMEIGIVRSVISLTLPIEIVAKTVGNTKIDLFYIYI